VGVSFSWAVAVDLTPASERPYVGSSGDNSVMSLALGYNGVERLLGRNGRGGLLSGVLGDSQAGTQQDGGQRAGGQRGDGQPGGNQAFVPPAGFQGAPGVGGQRDGGASVPPGGVQGFGGAPGGFGGPGGGFAGTGQAGALRLFTAPLSREVSWLLPFGLLSLVLLGVGSRVRWPLGEKHRAVVLWGGWLLTGGVFFSVAGFFHEYYLSTIAAPLAALFGIGAVEIWRARHSHRWLSFAMLCLAAGATLGFQIFTARSYVGDASWLAVGVVALAVGLALLALPASRRLGWTARAGFAVVVMATLVVPAVWSALGTVNSGGNSTMPSAYSGRSGGDFGGRMGGAGLQVDQALITYLQANTQGMKYLMAVPSSMQGSDYVLATGRPVLFLGGFGGQDKVKTVDDLETMVASGELRYFDLGGNGRGGDGPDGGQSDVTSWVTSTCKVVSGLGTASSGAGGRNASGSLYDCGASQ
jgi:4-amino-4-deoxy-L-arabinose transferase-like glycosyltransferase